jgi:hypothetical protein
MGPHGTYPIGRGLFRQGFHLTFSVETQLLAPLGIAEKVQDVPPLPE